MARICLVRQFFVPDDVRVRRELNALADAGHSVDVICMRPPGAPARDRYRGVMIHRLPMTHRRGGIGRYLLEYIWFPLMTTIYLALLDRRRRFDLIQVNTVPDWLVFSAMAPRLRGVPVLLDLHELMPEFFASKFRADLRHPAARALSALEQASIRFATTAITCTAQMRDAFTGRGAAPERIAVVMNSSDEHAFDPTRFPPRERQVGRFSLICHGTIQERYGLDTIVRAMDRLRARIPELELEVYGDGEYRAELQQLVTDLGLQGQVRFHGFAPMDQMLAAIADADAGVVAMKRDIFRDLTHCNKMFDLISMRRPVICSRTESVMAYFPNGAFRYFDADDDADLARVIEELHDNPELGRHMVESATAQNEPYRWPHQESRYLAVVDSLLEGRPVPVFPA
jgi:glycosyltransferase involved in cell wall biosynthesis